MLPYALLFLCCELFATSYGVSQKCFEGIGCFSNAYPFNNTQGALPDDIDVVGTKFELYTNPNVKRNGSTMQHYVIYPNQTSDIGASGFNSSNPTIFLIHGWVHGGCVQWVYGAVQALLQKFAMNVFCVNWSPGSYRSFQQSASNTRLVGAQTAIFARFLHTHSGSAYNDMHVIGHSFGAQVAGYVGEWLKPTTRLGRITGLDPAFSGFEGLDPVVRLDASDAMFVDIIHTNANSPVSGIGYRLPAGHADFFPNGGAVQPGCPSSEYHDINTCSHMRAPDLFIESVNSDCSFSGYPCSSYEDFTSGKCSDCAPGGCSRMGYYMYVDKQPGRGSFYLTTKDVSPFCAYQYRIELETGSISHWGRIGISIHGTQGSSEREELTVSNINLHGTQTFVRPFRQWVGNVTRVQLLFRANALFSLGTWSLRRLVVSPLVESGRYGFCGNDTIFHNGDVNTFNQEDSCLG